MISRPWIRSLLTTTLVVFFSSSSAAHALQDKPTGNLILDGVLSTLLYSGLGIVMAVVAYKVVDWITPGDLSKDLAGNSTALAIVAGATVLGICIIIASVIAS